MKLSTFFDNLNNKIDDFDVSTDIINDIHTRFADQEIPDQYADVLTKIISRKEAMIDKEIADHHQKKVFSNLTKAQTNRLLAQNFSDDEISLINQLSVEERLDKILEIQKSKISSHFSQSETDKVKQYEELMQREKERADKFQQTIISKETEFQKREENIRNEYLLSSYLDSVKYRTDTVPRETAISIMKNELKSFLDVRNAKLIFVHNNPKIVMKDDETEEYYDENNKSIKLNNLIIRLAQSQNLVDRTVIEKSNSTDPSKVIKHSVGAKKTDSSDYYKNFMNTLLLKKSK